jgi:S1-C subfamily serine protease
VIRIETSTCADGAIGTGFLIGHSLVATVEHVVDGATSIELVRHGHRNSVRAS